MPNTTLSFAIQALRRRRGWTQGQMASLVGVSIATIHRWEKGSARMGPDNMVALARALGWTNQRFNEFLDKVAAVEEVLDR